MKKNFEQTNFGPNIYKKKFRAKYKHDQSTTKRNKAV